MKTRYVRSIILGTALLQLVSCGEKSSTSGAGNIMSGIAATGAPISGGAVKIKGSNGEVVEDTTESDGSYSADVASLSEPYLVQVIAPSGEKYISVASQSALAEGKKINVTPLTHTIVANVFGKANGDEIFANFESEASNFSETKLQQEKEELVQKFVQAGLLGSGKIAPANLDLLNGEFVAGSGVGVDGLMDVISVNTDAAAGIQISLKGASAPIFIDKVDAADAAIVAIDQTALDAAKVQLSVLDQIRARMNALASLHSSKVACNGVPKDDDGACDVDNLFAAFAPFFHADYKEEGNSRDAGIWGWFCRVGEDDDAETRAECVGQNGSVKFENVALKDITLINYDSVSKVALISFNFYLNGLMRGSEEIALKYDEQEAKYDLVGNKKTFEYWIDTESLYSTSYNKTSNEAVDSYSVNLNFYLDDKKSVALADGQEITLTAVSTHKIFPNDSASMKLYVVTAPKWDNEQCSVGLTLSTTLTPYKSFNQSTGATAYLSYAEACPSNANPCTNGCPGSYFDYDVAQKVSLSEGQIAQMNRIERISMTNAAISLADEFTIKKPLIVNAFNAPIHIPSFGMSAPLFCENAAAGMTLNLSVASGTLSYVNIHHSFSSGQNMWSNESDKEDFWDLTLRSSQFTPSFSSLDSSDVIHYSHLYLSANDEFDRQFVRKVNCESPQI
ncbi:MAG: hypothetical protein NDI69_04250 [Bacteriovoracaceae bacterium]|nr:hypothetical protein [Bacteriovoracaceae bacterium]